MLFLIQWQRERHQLRRRRHSGVPARAGGGGPRRARRPPAASRPSAAGAERCLRGRPWGRSPEAIPAPRACHGRPLGGSRRRAAAPLPRRGAPAGSRRGVRGVRRQPRAARSLRRGGACRRVGRRTGQACSRVLPERLRFHGGGVCVCETSSPGRPAWLGTGFPLISNALLHAPSLRF